MNANIINPRNAAPADAMTASALLDADTRLTNALNGKASNASDSGNNLDTAPVLFGFGTGGTLLKHDMNALINETVKISDAGTLLAQAVAQLDSPNTQQKTAETRYLIVIPTV